MKNLYQDMHSVTFSDIQWHSVTFHDIPWHSMTFSDIQWHSNTYNHIQMHANALKCKQSLTKHIHKQIVGANLQIRSSCHTLLEVEWPLHTLCNAGFTQSSWLAHGAAVLMMEGILPIGIIICALTKIDKFSSGLSPWLKTRVTSCFPRFVSTFWGNLRNRDFVNRLSYTSVLAFCASRFQGESRMK